MPNPTAVLNSSGDAIENIIHYAKYLGKAEIRRKVFEDIYGRPRKHRSKKQIMDSAKINATSSQAVQNALDHLSKHHLISKLKNAGIVDDGSHWVYGKEEFIRAHKAQIIRFADDPKAASSVPTKRAPKVTIVQSIKAISSRELRKRQKLTILYLFANPDPGPDVSTHIRPEAEVRLVQEEIRGSKFRDNVNVQVRPAADFKTVMQGLNDLTPQIVHFSGHSSPSDLLTDNGNVTGPASSSLSFSVLAGALGALDKGPRVVILNSCWSAAGRADLLKSVDALIGMADSVSDVAAAAFAQYFYAAIASGATLDSAFKQGVTAVEAASISEKNTPKMFLRSGVDAKKIKLI